jgi:hypothetical protein
MTPETTDLSHFGSTRLAAQAHTHAAQPPGEPRGNIRYCRDQVRRDHRGLGVYRQAPGHRLPAWPVAALAADAHDWVAGPLGQAPVTSSSRWAKVM